MARNFIMGFLPWILFACFSGAGENGVVMGTFVATASIAICDWRELKDKNVLSWGTLAFFVFMLITGVFMHHPWVLANAYWFSTLVLAVIMMITIVMRRPFTMVYARRSCPKEYWDSPLFYEVNQIIAAVWVVGMLITTAGAYAGNSLWPWIVQALGFAGPVLFTIRFPDWYQHFKMARGGVAQLDGLSEVKHAGPVAYRTIGEGDPLFFFHGSSMTMHHWPPALLRVLSTHFTCIILDYPGTGLSRQYGVCSGSMTDWIQGVQPLLQRYDKQPVSLLGYSMGGYVVQSLAAKNPSLFSGLILIATDPGGPQAISMADEDLHTLTDMTGGIEAHYRNLGKLMFTNAETGRMIGEQIQTIYMSASVEHELSADDLALQNAVCEQWNEDGLTHDPIPKITSPALIITAAQDRIEPPANADLIGQLLPQAEKQIIPDAGHGLIYQMPEELARRIIQWASK